MAEQPQSLEALPALDPSATEDRGTSGDGRAETSRRGGRGRRERSPRQDETGTATNGLEAEAPAIAVTEPASASADTPPEAGDSPATEERRERKSRDRYGRDRRERAPRQPRDTAAESGPAEDDSPAPVANDAPSPVVTESSETPIATQPVVPATPPEAATGMPAVTAYALPVQALQAVAEASGLVWVSSDPEKVAAVQAAIAAEPAVVRIPRERPPVVILDEGPLVLVETRKDLRNLPLPF